MILSPEDVDDLMNGRPMRSRKPYPKKWAHVTMEQMEENERNWRAWASQFTQEEVDEMGDAHAKKYFTFLPMPVR